MTAVVRTVGRAGVRARSAVTSSAKPRATSSARATLRAQPPRHGVIEIQRSRLLGAAVRAVEELGYPNATVANITRRARVSRRTFYELFANREACLLAAIERVVGELEDELRAADLESLPWRERVRGGLAMILAFFDHEPALARMCVVQALRGGPAILEYREEVLAALAAVLDEGCPQGPRGEGRTRFTAEGLVGGALAILYARLLRGESGSLSGLLGELMGVIVLPYLGPAAARREQVRAASDIVDSSRARRQPGASVRSAADPLEGLPMRVTYRTARVIEVLAAHPGASNRAVSEHAGIHDQGQVSKLLARLERLGLVVNRGGGPSKGEPNAWYLTALGTRLAQRLSVGDRRRESAR